MRRSARFHADNYRLVDYGGLIMSTTKNSYTYNDHLRVQGRPLFESSSITDIVPCDMFGRGNVVSLNTGDLLVLVICTLHSLFAKGFNDGRRQTLTLLLYPGLGPATENVSQQAEFPPALYCRTLIDNIASKKIQ